MIGKTFETIKKNPLILLLFLAVYAVMFILGANTLMMFMPRLSPASNMVGFDGIALFSNFFPQSGLMKIMYLAIGFLALPILGNYIYEMCLGEVEDDWHKRGLQRGWSKVVILALAIMGVSLVVYILTFALPFILGDAVWVMFFVYIVLGVMINMYMVAAFSAIMAEDDFSKGMRNSFKIGKRFYLKILAVMIVSYAPVYIIGSIAGGFLGNPIFYLYTDLHWAVRLLGGVYSAAVTVFILTFSMQNYLQERERYDRELRG